MAGKKKSEKTVRIYGAIKVPKPLSDSEYGKDKKKTAKRKK